MKFLKSLFEHIKEIFLDKREEGKKFLGYFRQERLKFLEELTGMELGAYRRNTRPFIGYTSGNWLFVLFLTSQKKGRTYRVDISLCKKKGCPRYRFAPGSYLFYDSKHRGIYFYKLPKNLVKDYVFCGYCEGLEYLDKLRIKEVNSEKI
ncbi:hypothetical protein [Thermocrinis sp.]|jgi:hypothetical protein|uniref:hypothetical protein n=1 Tax=Thermocrinis sp. TaxID=2024383 RepID=UPI003C076C97